MKSRPPPYDHSACDRWEDTALARHRQEIRGLRYALVLALRRMERRRGGFCKPLEAKYTTIAREAGIHRNSVRGVLTALNGLVLEAKVGQAVIHGAATELRRMTLTEIQTGVHETILRSHTPGAADRVAAILAARPFKWKGQDIQPLYSVGKTGRVYARRSNVQAEEGGTDARLESLALGLPSDWAPFEVDFRRAGPSVLRQALTDAGYALKWPTDIYQKMATVTATKRDECKRMLNAIVYHSNTTAALRAAAPLAVNDPFFTAWVKAVEGFKAKLWAKSKPPEKGRRRFVTTLGGTHIEALKGDVHHGTLLNWFVQGSVADIINTATLRLIDDEASRHFRLAFPVHDSICLVGSVDSADYVVGIMQECARSIGVTLEVEVRRLQPADADEGATATQTPPTSQRDGTGNTGIKGSHPCAVFGGTVDHKSVQSQQPAKVAALETTP